MESIAKEFGTEDGKTVLRAFLHKIETNEKFQKQMIHPNVSFLQQKEQDVMALAMKIRAVSFNFQHLLSAFKFKVLESSWEQGETPLSRASLEYASEVKHVHGRSLN